MKRSTTSAVAVVLVIVLVVVGVVAVVGLATNGAPAVEVGDRTVSRESVNDELRAVAENEPLLAAAQPGSVSATRGSVRADVSTRLVVTGVVQELLIEDYLKRQGEEITAADRAEAEELVSGTTVGQFASGFPQWYLDRYTERIAAYTALARVLDTDLSDEASVDVIGPVLSRTAKRLGVEVDPRYGRFVASSVSVRPY
jgi:hypothetical protein